MSESAEHRQTFVVEPLQEHKQSIIILHGRGDYGMQFGGPLLFTKLPNGHIFREALPNSKFFFPTAPLALSEEWKMYEWFSISSLENPSENQENQIEGLKKSTDLVHKLLRKEIQEVGAGNVVLGGLSQGCATTLIALALWDGPPLRAAFGMSGWLPMINVLQSAVNEVKSSENKGVIALEALRKALGMNAQETTALFKTPLFICHGAMDEKVACQLGQEASSCLKQMGCSVEWREYEDLHHWYFGEELQHIASFIERSTS